MKKKKRYLILNILILGQRIKAVQLKVNMEVFCI